MTIPPFERRRESYMISSDPSLLDLHVINAAFGSEALYWCRPLPQQTLRACLDNSYSLGVYEFDGDIPAQVGLARLITDHATLAYLTDVFVLPSHQGRGLGNWLIECVEEVFKGMLHLRKALLVANVGQGEEYYRRMLGAERIEQGANGAVTLRRRGPAAKGQTLEDEGGIGPFVVHGS